MTVDLFVDHVKNVSLKKKVDNPKLVRGRTGTFYRMVNGAVVAEPIKESALQVETIDERLRRAGLSVPDSSLDAAGTDGTVEVSSAWYEPLMNCGRRQWWPFTMETLESRRWEWFATYDNPLTFNNYVDLFRPIGPYPGWGWNGANEFLGYPSDAQLVAVYGFGMGGSLAFTISVAVGGWCNTIVESDVMWSRYVNWTDNLFIALDPSNYARHIYPVTMHELGHTVGLSRALPEDYEHDYLTYMDGALNSNVVEDGRGLHAADAINLRANYGSSTNIADMGVESYYADTWTAFSGWLTSPGPDYGTNRLRTPLHPGDTFTANQLTVENMSQFAHSNVHIRLYLSTDATINALDLQLGDWHWPTFWGDSVLGGRSDGKRAGQHAAGHVLGGCVGDDQWLSGRWLLPEQQDVLLGQADHNLCGHVLDVAAVAVGAQGRLELVGRTEHDRDRVSVDRNQQRPVMAACHVHGQRHRARNYLVPRRREPHGVAPQRKRVCRRRVTPRLAGSGMRRLVRDAHFRVEDGQRRAVHCKLPLAAARSVVTAPVRRALLIQRQGGSANRHRPLGRDFNTYLYLWVRRARLSRRTTTARALGTLASRRRLGCSRSRPQAFT